MIVRILENTKQSVLIYTSKAAALSLVLSAISMFAIGSILPDIGAHTHDTSNPLVAAFSFLVFAPAAETLLMIPVFAFIRIGVRNSRFVAGYSALLWAGLHSLAWPYWGLIIALPFFVFSMAFLAWERISRFHAVGVTFIVHFMHNLLPTFAMLYSPHQNA